MSRLPDSYDAWRTYHPDHYAKEAEEEWDIDDTIDFDALSDQLLNGGLELSERVSLLSCLTLDEWYVLESNINRHKVANERLINAAKFELAKVDDIKSIHDACLYHHRNGGVSYENYRQELPRTDKES